MSFPARSAFLMKRTTVSPLSNYVAGEAFDILLHPLSNVLFEERPFKTGRLSP